MWRWLAIEKSAPDKRGLQARLTEAARVQLANADVEPTKSQRAEYASFVLRQDAVSRQDEAALPRGIAYHKTNAKRSSANLVA